MAADSTVQYLNRFLQSHPAPSLLHLASTELPPSAHLGFFRQIQRRAKGALEGLMLPKFQSRARDGDVGYMQRVQSKQGLTPLTPSGLFLTT